MWPWRYRNTLLILILIFVVTLVLWITTDQYTSAIGPLQAQIWSSPSPETVDEYTRQISTYLEGRRKGLTQEEITKGIFKVVPYGGFVYLDTAHKTLLLHLDFHHGYIFQVEFPKNGIGPGMSWLWLAEYS